MTGRVAVHADYEDSARIFDSKLSALVALAEHIARTGASWDTRELREREDELSNIHRSHLNMLVDDEQRAADNPHLYGEHNT